MVASAEVDILFSGGPDQQHGMGIDAPLVQLIGEPQFIFCASVSSQLKNMGVRTSWLLELLRQK